MGIAGSIVNTDFFEDYLGMRCEGVDEVEIIRRMTEGIYDKEEFAKALAGLNQNARKTTISATGKISKRHVKKKIPTGSFL